MVFSLQELELIAASGKRGRHISARFKIFRWAALIIARLLYRSPLLANDEVNLSGDSGSLHYLGGSIRHALVTRPAQGLPTAARGIPHQHGETPSGRWMAFKVELKDALKRAHAVA